MPTDEKMPPERDRRDFFISYTSKDQAWAEWIAMQLEVAGYTTFIQAWDFRPGSNFIAEMDKATRQADSTLLVLSSAYQDSRYTLAEWTVAYRRDPTGEKRRIIPVRVEHCEVEGLLGPLVFIDLVALDETSAHERLLTGVQQGRAKPTQAPFPASSQFQALPTVLERPIFPGCLPHVWHVPSPRNPFFTGRQELLTLLRTRLTTGRVAALTQRQAISGLGGIGKTQIALEYVYQYRDDYQYVFWTRAATRETLSSDFVTIADLLQLPEKDEQDQNQVIAVVKQWFAKHQQWLLVFDNADDVEMVGEFAPADGSGHVLLTTRAQAMGALAQRIDVENMGLAEGTLFLLHRAGMLAQNMSLDQASDEQLAGAEAITIEMDFLPLALDQAGAYIEEVGCSLLAYLDLYRLHRSELLHRRGQLSKDHPEPVATTWSLSFQRVEQASPVAADLLRFYAFLDPDAIPEEIVLEGTAHLGPALRSLASDPFKLNRAIEALRKFSLIRRNAGAQTVSIHRLVQAVLKDEMKRKAQRRWAERAIRATNAVFPKEIKMETWAQCQRLLPQAQACVMLVKDYKFLFEEAAHLLYRTAFYLSDHALYTQAEPLYKKALQIQEQIFGLSHLDVATSLTGLALLYKAQGRYVEAESLYQQTLVIREKLLEPNHPDIGTSLTGLANLSYRQGKYRQAEPLYKQALHIWEQTLGPSHPRIAHALTGLASALGALGSYEEAERLYQRALLIEEQALGPNHQDVATQLNNLAQLYRDQGRYEQAEPLFLRALSIWEQALGPDHPDVTYALGNLAELYRTQGRYEQAEALLYRTLGISEQAFGTDHEDVAYTLHDFANLYREQGKMEQAEPYYRRALSIREQVLGLHHPDTAETLHDFAAFWQAQGEKTEAVFYYRRALAIREQVLGPEHPKTKATRIACVDLEQQAEQQKNTG